MKRALCVCLVLVLMLGLSVAASALGGVTVETAGDVAPGSTVLVSVTVEGGVDVVGCQIEPLFDTTMFQLVSYHWSLRPDSEMTDPASGAWVAEWLTPVTLRGKVLTFTLKVLPGAAGKAASISCRIDAWDEGFEPVDLGEVTAAQIGGTCAHTYGQKEDPAYIQTPGDCRNATVYFVSCTKCGQKGTGTFIGKQLGDHVYTAKLETEDRLAQRAIVSPAPGTIIAVPVADSPAPRSSPPPSPPVTTSGQRPKRKPISATPAIARPGGATITAVPAVV